jgi:hypothetical protein
VEEDDLKRFSSFWFCKQRLTMTSEAIQHWLEKRLSLHISGCWVGAVLALLAGVFVLFLIFWVAYFAVLMGEWGISAAMELTFNHKFHLGHAWRLVISGLFLVALFIEWIRRSPWELGNYGRVNSPLGAQALVMYDGAFGAFAMLLANPQASASMIAEILYTGPRLVLGARSLACEAYRSRSFSSAECARILQLLVSRENAVTYEEFGVMQQDTDWIKLKSNLARFSGVIFLEKGLSLTDDLRQELCNLPSGN